MKWRLIAIVDCWLKAASQRLIVAEPLVNMPTARLIGSAWLIALEALVKSHGVAVKVPLARLKKLCFGESRFATVKVPLARLMV